MKRRSLTLAAIALAMLALVSVVLWIRSYRLIEGLIWRYSHQASIGIATGPGRFYLGYSTEPELPDSPRLEYANIAVQYPLSEAAPPVFEFAGFGIYTSAQMKTARLPFWFLVVTFAFLAALCSRRARPVPAGCCAKCVYDLRASPGRCPECGELVAAGHAAAG